MSAADRILVLCHPAARPSVQAFLSVLADAAASEHATVPWHIDNKYYTALVHFLIHDHADDVAEAMRDVPAVIYAYTGADPCMPPQSLVQSITAASPDLSFAVRIPHHTPNPDDEAVRYDPIAEEESMDDAGLEYVDLSGLYDRPHDSICAVGEADGPITPRESLHRLRESLQTIMWPSMVRKPPPTRHGKIRPPPDDSLPVVDGTSTAARQPVFPVSFSPSSHTDRGTSSDHTTTQIPPQAPRPPSMNPFAVSPRVEAAFLCAEEQKLDAWLDEDAGAPAVVAGSDGGVQGGAFDDDFATGEYQERATATSGQQDAGGDKDEDEDEFSAFQSAPLRAHLASPPSSTHLPAAAAAAAAAAFFDKEDHDEEQREGEEEDDLGLPIDPTALLHRLQSVRSELAGVPDEEERRRRAALEVQRVLQSLGMGLDDLEL